MLLEPGERRSLLSKQLRYFLLLSLRAARAAGARDRLRETGMGAPANRRCRDPAQITMSLSWIRRCPWAMKNAGGKHWCRHAN